jgi:hypothetical protein
VSQAIFFFFFLSIPSLGCGLLGGGWIPEGSVFAFTLAQVVDNNKQTLLVDLVAC